MHGNKVLFEPNSKNIQLDSYLFRHRL